MTFGVSTRTPHESVRKTRNWAEACDKTLL